MPRTVIPNVGYLYECHTPTMTYRTEFIYISMSYECGIKNAQYGMMAVLFVQKTVPGHIAVS